jgi:hypothetical protein
MALSQVVVPFDRSLDFGVGLNSTNASPMGKVVQGEVTGVSNAEGATVAFDVSRIMSTRDLEEKLNVSAKASYSAGPFANVSGRLAFAQSSRIHTNSLFFAITSTILLGQTSIDDPLLTPAAAALVDNPQMFNTRFGDMFVRGIDRGGIFVAVMKLDASSDEEAESISSELSGTYGLFSAEAKSNFERVEKRTNSEVSIRVYHEGGPIGLVMKSLDDPLLFYGMFQDWLKSFVDDPDRMAVPYAATLAPVAIANGPLPPNAADAEHASDVLLRCAKERSACFDGLNLMDAILQTPARYTFVAPASVADVRAAASGYQEDLQVIAGAASAAMNHPASAKMPAAFAQAIGQAYPQGLKPNPMPTLNLGDLATMAARGARLAAGDLLLSALRDMETAGQAQRGFDIGLALAESQNLQGPGKEKFKQDHVNDFSSGAYQRAVDYMIDRNANRDLASRGAAAVQALPDALAARAALPLSNQWLGFNIAAGIFGAAPLAHGNTLRGPGSNGIRDRLSGASQLGYDAALSFYRIP